MMQVANFEYVDEAEAAAEEAAQKRAMETLTESSNQMKKKKMNKNIMNCKI